MTHEREAVIDMPVSPQPATRLLTVFIALAATLTATACSQERGPSDRLRELDRRMLQFQEVVDRYERLIREGRRDEIPLYEQRGKVLIERGPPLRLAFRDEKWGDNWGGFVYDPSREVEQIGEARKAADLAGKPFNGWQRYHDDPDGLGKLIMLFAGTMCNSEHLRDDWYWCAFN